MPSPPSTSPASPGVSTIKQASKLDLAERSYQEVLDATKHQDDKVGRFLTAIAFLTTGAIALIAANPGTALARDFVDRDGTSHPLLAWATGAFLAFTLGSVTLLLLCLSVPVRLPKSSRDRLDGSHLFYTYIASRTTSEWSAKWELDENEAGKRLQDLENAITNDYIGESHNLAERTNAKYRHSYEASWLFVCALLFLSIAIYLRILTSLHPKGDVKFDKDIHLTLLVIIVSLHALLQVYTRAVHDIRSAGKAYDAAYDEAYNARAQFLLAERGIDIEERVDGQGAASQAQRRRTPLSVVAPVGFSIAVAGTWNYQWVAPAIAGLSVFVGLLATFDTWLEGDTDKPDAPGERIYAKERRAWLGPFGIAAGSAAVAWLSFHLGGAWQLAAVPLPVLVLGLFNASRPIRSHRQTRALVRKRAKQRAVADADHVADELSAARAAVQTGAVAGNP